MGQAWKAYSLYFGWNHQSCPITRVALIWKLGQRVQRPMLWLPAWSFFSPLLALCGARVNTFNWLGASVYGAFIMPTEQSELSLHQLGWAVEINQNSSRPSTDSSPQNRPLIWASCDRKKVVKTMKLWYRVIKVWRLECGEVFRLFVPEINVQRGNLAWFYLQKIHFILVQLSGFQIVDLLNHTILVLLV